MRDRITTSQVALLITSNVIGVSYLFMPRVVVQYAGRDGWLSILLAGSIILGVNALLVLLGRKFPGQTIFGYVPLLLGRFLGQGLNLLIIAYFSLGAALALRTFGDVTKIFLLERTPLEVIMISMLAVVGYQTSHGLNPLARMAQVLFPLMLAPLTLVLVLGQGSADYGELLPPLQQGLLPVFRGIFGSWGAFGGFGLVAVLLPRMFRPGQALAASSAGILLPLLFYLGAFVTSLVVFGETELSYLIYPILELARETEFPGSFLERLDILILSLWVLTSFSTVSISTYVAVWGAGEILGLKEYRGLVALWLPLIYLLAILPQNFAQASELGQVIVYCSMFLALVVLLLLVLAYFRGKGTLP